MLSSNGAEHLGHQPLIGSPSIFQTERHHIVTIETMGSDERCFFRIWGVHGDLVISQEGIQKRHHTMPGRSVHDLIYSGQREAVFRACIIEVRIIHTYSPLVPLFWDNHHVGQLIRVLHGFDKSILQKVIDLGLDYQVTVRMKAPHFLPDRLRGWATFNLCEACVGLIPVISS